MAVPALGVWSLVEPASLALCVLAERVSAFTLLYSFFPDVVAFGGFIGGPFWQGALLYEAAAAAWRLDLMASRAVSFAFDDADDFVNRGRVNSSVA